MLEYPKAPVPVREDLKDAHRAIWDHLGNPGAVFTADERSRILSAARRDTRHHESVPIAITSLARFLYDDPAVVDGAMVRAAAASAGEPAVVETIAAVSMLSAVDGTHRALGVELEPLPEPQPGPATGKVLSGLTRRRTHVPMPQGAIPRALDLIPDASVAFRASFGAQYMTGSEMSYSNYARTPGLNRAQMELISARTSILNECFY